MKKNDNTVLEPAFSETDRCIVFSANAEYIPLTSVAIQSILNTGNPSEWYDIILLHRNMDSNVISRLQNMVSQFANVSLRFFNVEKLAGSGKFYVENRSFFSAEAYFRLYIPWILSDEYNTALYIDGDMLITRNINDIFSYDLGDCQIGAVRDYWGICNCYIPGDIRRAYRESIGLTDIDGYVISATVLFNLKRLRQTHTLPNVQKLISSRNWKQHDQDVLNILCQGSILYISPEWGMMSDYGNNHYLPVFLQKELEEVSAVPAIIHYGGERKPFSHEHIPHDLIFWRTASKTPFFPELFSMIRRIHYKHYVARYLESLSAEQSIFVEGANLFYRNLFIGKTIGCVSYRVIRIRNGILHLEGFCSQYDLYEKRPLEVEIRIGDAIYIPDVKYPEIMQTKGIPYAKGQAFKAEIDLGNIREKRAVLEVYVRVHNIYQKCDVLDFERWCAVSNRFDMSYYHSEGWMLTFSDHRLIVSRSTLLNHIHRETCFCKEIWKNGGIAGKKAVLVRTLVHLLRMIPHKPIWLISDRVSRADENGEVFFRYLNRQGQKDICPIFVINSTCPDYKRMQQYGHVIASHSITHKILLLMAEYSISSQTDMVFRCPFCDRDMYRDMLGNLPFIFLQHGIIKDDLSGLLCRRQQQLAGFVVSAPMEYESIMNGKYGYSKDEVWLTGLPRYDLLEDHAEKTITVMPTWRRYLSNGQNGDSGIWSIISDFSKSEYALFYKGLMEHPRLQEQAKALGYRIQFKGHPSFLRQEKEFAFSKDVSVVPEEIPYREIFATSSLIVTDYSSAVFDFAYMHKPVIYAQFDRETFYSGNHMYKKGYFDYEQNGFGEVTRDLEDTVNQIIEYMENDCQLKDIYKQRIDSFFAYRDKENCRRIFDKIIEHRSKS